MNNLRAQTGQLLSAVENRAQSIATLGGVLPNNPLAKNTLRLISGINLLRSQYDCVQLDSVLGRLGNNVAAAPAGSREITVNGGTLYTLAQQYYGDATAWTTIARANNLSDPQLSGTHTLLIPATPDTAGGVLNA